MSVVLLILDSLDLDSLGVNTFQADILYGKYSTEGLQIVISSSIFQVQEYTTCSVILQTIALC